MIMLFLFISVTTASDTNCVGGSVAVPDLRQTPEGFMASMVARERVHGSERCPWHLNAAPGQTINLTLFDFRPRPNDAKSGISNLDSNSATSQRKDLRFAGIDIVDPICDYGFTIRERGDNVPMVLCDNGQSGQIASTRNRVSYKSKSNELYLHFLTPNFQEDERYLIVHYQGKCNKG